MLRRTAFAALFALLAALYPVVDDQMVEVLVRTTMAGAPANAAILPESTACAALPMAARPAPAAKCARTVLRFIAFPALAGRLTVWRLPAWRNGLPPRPIIGSA